MVLNGQLHIPIARHHNVAKATDLVVLFLLHVALLGVETGALDLHCQGLKVSINYKQPQLYVVVAERNIVCPPLAYPPFGRSA